MRFAIGNAFFFPSAIVEVESQVAHVPIIVFELFQIFDPLEI